MISYLQLKRGCNLWRRRFPGLASRSRDLRLGPRYQALGWNETTGPPPFCESAVRCLVIELPGAIWKQAGCGGSMGGLWRWFDVISGIPK